MLANRSANINIGNLSDSALGNPHTGLTLTANARFLDDQGDPLPLPLLIDGAGPAGVQIVSDVEIEIPPLGTVSIRTDGKGELVAGTARVSSNGTLGGLVYFNFPGIGLAGIPASPRLSNFLTPVRRQALDESQTGIAISNLASEEAVLRPVLHDADGRQLAEGAAIMLPAGGHVARFLHELFEDVLGPDFVGTLLVNCDSCRLAGVALELGSKPGNFTAVPVIELPTP